MKIGLKNRFQLGVCEWSVLFRGRNLCESAKISGLNCVQLGVGTEIFKGEGLSSEKLVEEYQQASQELGVEIVSISPQFVDEYSFTMPRTTEEIEIVDHLIGYTMKMCEKFHCNSFLLPVLCRNDIVDGTSFHNAVSYIRKYAREAREKNLEIYLELNQDLSQLHNLLDAVDCSNVKVFFDSQNLYAQRGISMAKYFTSLSRENLIGGVHVKDGNGGMLSGSLLGEGTSGFYKTCDAILESEYSGPILIESVYSKPGVCNQGTEHELLKRDADTLHRIFG